MVVNIHAPLLHAAVQAFMYARQSQDMWLQPEPAGRLDNDLGHQRKHLYRSM